MQISYLLPIYRMALLYFITFFFAFLDCVHTISRRPIGILSCHMAVMATYKGDLNPESRYEGVPNPESRYGKATFEDFSCINSLRPRQNRRHFAEDVFKCNFLNKNVWIPIKFSLTFVPKGPINKIPATGDKSLSEPMMTQFNDAYMRHSASMS